MAAELPPSEVPTTTVGATVTNSNTETVALAEPETTAAPTALPPAPKRQRRPSVRLGEIGEQSATLSYESHQIRRSKPPWRLPKESSKSVKARSLTNLVNGNEGYENQEIEGNNQNGEINLEFGYRKKAKRAKRVRSNWMSSKVDESRDDGDEGFGFRDSDSPILKEQQSPAHSNDNNVMWHGHRRTGTGRVRVSENDAFEMDNYPEKFDYRDPKWSASEGVRTWLIELGLSRYAPIFEVHEVDDEVLPLLTLEDLKDMGISAVGSRRKLYSAIQKLLHNIFTALLYGFRNGTQSTWRRFATGLCHVVRNILSEFPRLYCCLAACIRLNTISPSLGVYLILIVSML